MKKITITLFTYTLTLLIILNCYSLACMIYPNQIFYSLISANFLLLFLLRRRIKVRKNAFVLVAIYVTFMLLLIIQGFWNFEFIFSCVIPFTFAVLYFDTENVLLDFWEKYTNIVAIICLLSLIFFVLGTNLGIVGPTAIYPSNEVGWGNITYRDYFHLYCDGQEAFAFGYSGARNIALFVEGPMLTFVSCLALYYEFFLRVNGTRKSVIIPIILAIVTSLSTTGMLLIAIMIYLKFYDKIKKNKLIKICFLPVVTAAIVYLGIYVVQDKFVSNVYSASVRADDIMAALKCFLSDPINGIGYNSLEGIDPFRSYSRTNAGLSTGLGGILAYGGLIWSAWYIIPPIVAVKRYITHSQYRDSLGFIFLYVALLVVTVVQSRVLCTLCMTMSWLIIMNPQIAKGRLAIN